MDFSWDIFFFDDIVLVVFLKVSGLGLWNFRQYVLDILQLHGRLTGKFSSYLLSSSVVSAKREVSNVSNNISQNVSIN